MNRLVRAFGLLALVGLPLFALGWQERNQDGAMGRNPAYGRATGASPGPTRGPKIWGVDISKWQGNINFPALASAVSFVVMRSDYGTTRDQKYLQNRAGLEAQGTEIGFYHYAYPQYHSATESANYFADNVGPLKPGQFAVLDFEENWSGDKVAWCKTWLDTVQARLGVKPLIYINRSTAGAYDWSPVINGDYGLWLAYWDYDKDASAPSTPWPFVAMRQYSDRETVPGVTGNVDGDVFYGTLDMLKLYGHQIGVGEGGQNPQHFIDCYNRNGGLAALGKPQSLVEWTNFSPKRAEEQPFSGGNISSSKIIDNEGASATYPACLVYGAISTVYHNTGGPNGPLGYLVGDQTAVTGGWSLLCQNGKVYERSGVGLAYMVTSPFLAYYQADGETGGALGWPSADSRVAGPSPQGSIGQSQAFTGGSVYSSVKGVWGVGGSIGAAYGGPTSALGFPASGQTSGGTSPVGTVGVAQLFEGGAVYSTTAKGTWPVSGEVYAQYGQDGGPTGRWGYPVSAERTVSGRPAQDFEGGTLSPGGAGTPAIHLRARVVSTGTATQVEVTVSNNGSGTAHGVQVLEVQLGATKTMGGTLDLGDLVPGGDSKKNLVFDIGFGAKKVSLLTCNVKVGATVTRLRYKLAKP